MPGVEWNHRLPLLLDQETSIPTDVVFVIEEDDNWPGQGQEVKAHRMVLGLTCDAFKNMLFVTNTQDKISGRIPVKETTADAFRTMVNAIYKTKSIEEALQHKSVDEVFSVLDLVTKYVIPELVEDTRKVLASFHITDTSLLEVATDTLRYTNTFEQEARDLLMVCAKFLKPKLGGENAVFEYLRDNRDHRDTVHELLVLMMEVKDPACPNCQQVLCQDGKVILQDKFRVGMQVTNDNSCPYWGNSDSGKPNQKGEVTMVTMNVVFGQVRVKPIGDLVPGSYNCNTLHNMTYNMTTPTFLYYCQGNLTNTN